MFDEFGPNELPQPPAGAMGAAMRRGRTIRRQRYTVVASAVALGAALIGGFAVVNPLTSDKTMPPPAHTSIVPAPDYSVIVTGGLSSEKTSLDFGTLTKVTTRPDGAVTLTVARQQLYSGAEAKKRNKGVVPLDDNSVVEDHHQTNTFVLDAKAPLEASTDGEPLLRKVSLKQLIQVMHANDGLPVWMRHNGGPNGPVTALSQQWSP